MKKNLLLLLAVLASVLTAGAQTTWWGLWNTGFSLKPFALFEDGTTDLYLRLTAQNSPLLVGGSVSGMRFWVADKSAIVSASVWMSTSYTRGAAPTIMKQDVPTSQLLDLNHDGSPTVVHFEEPIAILPPGNPYVSVLVGMTLQMTSGQSVTLLGSTGGSAPSGSFFLNGRDQSAVYGRLPLQVLAGGPLIPTIAATPGAITEQKERAGLQATLSLPVVAAGSTPISSIDYVVSIDGQPQEQKHHELPEAIDELGKAFIVPAIYDAPASPAEHQLTVSVTRVNDTDNPQADLAVTAKLTTLSHDCTKRTVMEEFTGSWCHNCIRGIAGIGRLQEQFADRFIPIAIHSSDPMQVDDYRNSSFYKSYVAALGGLPSCAIDRLIGCDPYCGLASTGPFATDQIVEYALSQTAVADLDVEARFTNQSLTDISCNVTTHFAYDSPDAPYRLILVLTADSLTGEGRDWEQINGYNDYEGDDPALLVFAGAGSRLIPSSFNHVAIDIVGADQGIEGSITAPLSHEQPQTFTHALSIAGNALAQHKDRLHVVVMLIDTQSGSIINAATANVALPTLGIAGATLPTATSTQRYDLQGRQRPSISNHPSAHKGIIIENGKKRMSTHSPY